METFNPAYSQALAAWALATHLRRRGAGSGADPKSPRRLHLVEVGGGTGLHARLVCDWLSANAPPDVWQGMRYTLLDVSEAQAEKQRASLSESGHGGRCRVVVCPAGKWARRLTALEGGGGEGPTAASRASRAARAARRRPTRARKGGKGGSEGDEDVIIFVLEVPNIQFYY